MAKKPPKPVIGIIVAAVLLLAGGGIWWWSASSQPEPDPRLRASGTVEATDYQVAPLISAQVKEVKVSEGDQVRVGDTVVLLDTAALELALDQAKQGVTSAQANVENQEEDGSKADVKAAKAKLAQAEAAVKLAELQLGYATVTAPAPGTVTSVIANAGQGASPSRVLLTILDTSEMFARVYVPEADIARVKPGGAATISDDSGNSYTGKVDFVATEAEFTPNTVQTQDQRTKLVYQVRVSIADTSGALKAGMPVDVVFE
ncbi:MAG: efflux RND transporter periplasmic adaptor subunit [Propionibacteriaceae bacterium]|nr:efflux RND transporter periplasmic adaptor subunit [Propionibacteriaceae bacterium]